MEITVLAHHKKKALIDYNTRVYPFKKVSAEKYLDFWLSNPSTKCEDNLILEDETGEIHGQILTSPMSYYYKGETKKTVWLFDLIVNEELRKSAWGIDVILSCFQKHPNSFSTGSGPTALPIHLKLGNKLLGEIRKYVGVVNPLGLITSIFRGQIPIHRFPHKVLVNSHRFLKVDKKDIFSIAAPYNECLWEPSRDKDYLEWRFFNDLHQYAFYKDEFSNDYFVVRTIVQKGVTVLLLVDYRCDVSTETDFQVICQALVRIAKQLHLGVVVTGSSLSIVDSVLEKNKFKSIGRPRPIIGFLKVKDRKIDIDNRNFAFVTLADSDGETNWK